MTFSLNKSLEVIESTPGMVSAMLQNLSEDWTTGNEGENTWTAKEVVAHLIVCEQINWLPRARIMLSDDQDKTLDPMDMHAQVEIAQSNSLQKLLDMFKQLKHENVAELKAFNLQEDDFSRTANHPVIGKVNLQQLISTWVTHDMSHIAQIARIIAKQNKGLVGSFKQYLKILES